MSRRRGGRSRARGLLRLSVRGRAFTVAEETGVHPIDSITRAAVRLLPVRPGESAADLGCGSGVYGIAAALLGARRVLFTDLDPRALRAARSNALRNGVRGARFRAGDLLVPLGSERFDLIIANLPQTPGPVPFRPAKWGGRDGTLHLQRFFRGAHRSLFPGGRAVFLLHELADARRVLRLARKRFRVRTVLEVRRTFDPAEYDAYLPGLFAYLDGLRRKGVSRFHGRGRRRWFRLRLHVATLR
jgi:methylase of polypeptide subunit release factors